MEEVFILGRIVMQFLIAQKLVITANPMLVLVAAFISTIVGAGAAFFGLYVGKPGARIPKSK